MASYKSSYAPSSHRSSYNPRSSVAPQSAAANVSQFVPPTQASNVPPGTLPPGTIVRVGEYEVTVDRFLSEGGFAHVYLASSASPIPAGSPTATTKHVLKRMAVPDTKGVQEVGKEVEVMKLVRNHPKIVNIIEASVAELPGGSNGSKGYEIYILMEWCPGGGIIDMMNTRLQNRLTESEILKIFSDTVEAVAHMHYQNPPLIHRDLKVENILLTPPQTFKLCDFGSTTTPLPRDKVPTAVEKLQALEHDINKTTTLQYRAPELVDIWGRKGYDEKIDIWALGVFLYKLCYYTTPFEEHGPLAILSAQYKIPHYPAYSNNVKGLIAGMLQESASARPNIYQLHEQVCRLRGTTVRIENIYAKNPSSSTSKVPIDTGFSSVLSSGPVAPASSSSPSLAETISPMRRGRPAKGGPVAAVAKALEDHAAPRLTKTGSNSWDHDWEAMGASSRGGSAWPTGSSAPTTGNGFSDSFASIGTKGATSGFGDSFRPSSPLVSKASGAGTPKSATSPALPPTSFADLTASSLKPAATPSSSSVSGQPKSPLLPSTQAVLNDQSWRTRPVSVPSNPNVRGSPAPPVSEAPIKPAIKSVDEVGDEKRFESTYPDLDGLDSFTTIRSPVSDKPSSSKPAVSPIITSPAVNSPSSLTLQLTGESTPAAGPTLPRRPPTTSSSISSASSSKAPGPIRATTKPDLISRSSQTSPHLLVGGGWRSLPGQQSMLNKQTVAPNELGQNPVALPGMAKEGRSMPPSQSISSRWNPPSESSFNGPVGTVSPIKTKPIDLLGDDEDNEDEFAPKPLDRSTELPKSPVIDQTPALSNRDRTSVVGTTELNFESAREKFRPVKPSESPSASTSAKVGVSSLGAPSRPPVEEKAVLKASIDEDEAAKSRFPEIGSIPAATGEATLDLTTSPQPESENWQPIVENELDSSADEAEEIEDFAPRSRLQGPRMPREDVPQSPLPEASIPAMTSDQVVSPVSGQAVLPPITRVDSSSTDGGGDIDLAPALASIRKFAPTIAPKPAASSTPAFKEDEDRRTTVSAPSRQSNLPPLVAPKPQSVKKQDQIDNLVSRYEGLAASGPPPVSDSSTRKPLPPAPGAKPTTLRQSSASGKARPIFGSKRPAANTTLASDPIDTSAPHWASRQASIGDFSSRFPDADGLDAHLTGETKPSPKPSTPPRSTGPTPSTPSSPVVVTASRPPPFKPVPPPTASNPGTPQRSFALPPKLDANQEEEEERFAGVSNMKSRWESLTREQAKEAKGPGKVEKRKSWAVV